MTLAFTQIDKKYGLPEGTMAALVKQESGGNPNAVSPVGARGLVQFMPPTRREVLQKTGLDAYSTDPNVAVEAGASYLATLAKRYDGDISKALAAYNGGMGNVDKAVAKALKTGGNWLDAMPSQETRNYVPQVLARAGITMEEMNRAWDYQREGTHTKEQDDQQYTQRADILRRLGMKDEEIKAIKPKDMLGTIFFAIVLNIVSQLVVTQSMTPVVGAESVKSADKPKTEPKEEPITSIKPQRFPVAEADHTNIGAPKPVSSTIKVAAAALANKPSTVLA